MSDDRPSTAGPASEPSDRGERTADAPTSDARRPEGTRGAGGTTDDDDGDHRAHYHGSRDHAPGTTSTADHDPGRDPERAGADDDSSDGLALLVSLLFGLGLALGSVLLVTWLDPGFEGLLRVRPTVPGGGVAAGWVAGNADAALNLMIAIVHLADVVMGVFILVMVFIHWAAFRRLAARMRPPGSRLRERDVAATDGGEHEPTRPASDVPDDGGDRG